MNTNEVLTTWSENQNLGAKLPCPRCGKWKMHDDIHSNALSRRFQIYVCSGCGTEEALCDMPSARQFNNDSVDDWFAVKVFGNPSASYTYDKTYDLYSTRVSYSISFSSEDIDDIMCAALEGGIAYWCDKAEVVGDYLGEYAREQISRGGTLKLYDSESDEVYELTKDKFINGIALAAKESVDWIADERIQTFFIDANVADTIIQCALFGEVVYG